MSAGKALLSGHRTWTFYQTFDSNKNTSSIFGTHEPFFKHRPAGLCPLLFWGWTYCRKHPWKFIDMMGMSLVETERCWTCDIGSTSSVGSVGVGWRLRSLMRASMDLQVAASKPCWGNAATMLRSMFTMFVSHPICKVPVLNASTCRTRKVPRVNIYVH